MSSFDTCSKPRNASATCPRDSGDKIKTLRKGVFVLGFDKISQLLFLVLSGNHGASYVKENSS